VGAGITIIGAQRHCPAEDCRYFGTDGAMNFVSGSQRIILRISQGRGARQSIRRLGAGKQMIKGGAESIDVALWSRALILYLFQRRIAPRIPKDTGGRVAAGQIRRLRFGQSKIEQSNLAAGGNFKIVRFDVTMNYLAVAGMQVDERIQQLIGPGNHLVTRERPRLLGNDLSQVSA